MIKITKYESKFYVIVKSIRGLKFITIHSNEKNTYQKIVSYPSGYTLHKIENMHLTQLKEIIEYLLLV